MMTEETKGKLIFAVIVTSIVATILLCVAQFFEDELKDEVKELESQIEVLQTENTRLKIQNIDSVKSNRLEILQKKQTQINNEIETIYNDILTIDSNRLTDSQRSIIREEYERNRAKYRQP